MTGRTLPNRLRDAASIWRGSDLARLLDEAADALEPAAGVFQPGETISGPIDFAPGCEWYRFDPVSKRWVPDDPPQEPPPRATPCGATQQSDEMYCARCRLRWDVNDPEPPSCRA